MNGINERLNAGGFDGELFRGIEEPFWISFIKVSR